MRKLTLLAAALLSCLLIFGQAGQINQINIVNFTVKNTLPASVESWMTTPGALMMTAQKVPGTQVREPMMVLQIRSGSAIICGNTMATAKRIDPFDVRVFTTADLLGLLGNCKELKPGNYTICAQFFNIDKVAISREVCRDFRVEDAAVDYSPPTLITPDNGKNFTVAELQRPVQFRWTPLVPKPRDPVTYRLRVWQLMQGQNGVAAMRSNTPIADKEVKEITQATVTGLLTGPCRPPYLCDFIWNVQALNREGKPMGRNNGTSEPYTFSATETGETPGEIKPPKNTLPENNKQFTTDEAKGTVKFEWLPVSPKQTEPVTYKLKVWQLMQGQTGAAAMKNNPIAERSVTDATQATIAGLYTGPCRPPYLCDFIWSVQAVTRDGKPLGSNEGTSEPFVYRVNEKNNVPGEIKPPKNTLPANNKQLLVDEAKGVVKFEWLPVSPKQTEPVTYKLKVWQLMQGQTGAAAMKNNKPLVERSVTDATQANVSGLLTGPCRPPFLCDFIWNVQAVNREGKPLGGNNGNSEPTMFFVTQYIIQLDSIKVLCTNTPGVYSFSFTLTNVNPGTANLTNFAITSSTPAGATFGPYAPPIGTGISTGNQLTITGTINAAPNLSNICIGAEITDAANSFWKASKDTCIKVEPCRCDACDEKNFVMNTPKPAQINWANNALTFTQPVTITTTPPKTIKNIFAELVYYEMIPQVPDCIPCNKDASLYGHFANGTNSQQWSGPQSNLNISITTPNVPCCSTVFRWCIRYKVEFTDCTVCSKVICYEKKKEGCVATGTGTEPSDPKLPK